jgi:hypothetical protein
VPFRTLSTLVGLIANLIPLYGVPYWQSHTFQLLMLYGVETVIIAVLDKPADRVVSGKTSVTT